MDWRSKAACLTVDPELFFPIGNTGPAIRQVAEAKAVRRARTPRRLLTRTDHSHDQGRGSAQVPRPRSLINRCAPRAHSPTARQAASRLIKSVTRVPPPSRGAHSMEPRSSPRTI